jgi:hypothetical protein
VDQRVQEAVVVSLELQAVEEELLVTEVHRAVLTETLQYLVEAVAKVEDGIFSLPVQAINVQLLVIMAVAAVVVVITLTLINPDMDIHFFTDLEVVVAELEYMV